MRENNLNVRLRRFFTRTTNSQHGLPVCENLLTRDFATCRSGQKRVSDITYLHSSAGFVYLTTVMDLFDRRIIGWALSAGRETGHTTFPALLMAFTNRPSREGRLFHSDQDVQ
jgi:transposase InsO family protein